MEFSEIIVRTVLSLPFQESAYIARLNNRSSCLVVDPGLEPEKILLEIERENLSPEAILITHGHGDHIGGIEPILKKYKDCKIYVGENDANKLIDSKENLSGFFGFSLTVPPADVLLRDGDKIEIAGIPVEVLHTPGHSKGHVVYLIRCEPKSILFSGDVIFEQSIGRSDFPDGDHRELIRSIETKILTLPDDTVIYSGHGNPTTVGAERRMNPFLR